MFPENSSRVPRSTKTNKQPNTPTRQLTKHRNTMENFYSILMFEVLDEILALNADHARRWDNLIVAMGGLEADLVSEDYVHINVVLCKAREVITRHRPGNSVQCRLLCRTILACLYKHGLYWKLVNQDASVIRHEKDMFEYDERDTPVLIEAEDFRAIRETLELPEEPYANAFELFRYIVSTAGPFDIDLVKAGIAKARGDIAYIYIPLWEAYDKAREFREEAAAMCALRQPLPDIEEGDESIDF